jgi:putative hydrolase of the HAD superfamily
MQTLQASSERICHVRHSVSRDSYVTWTRSVLEAISAAGITSETKPYVIPALEQHHQAPMRPIEGVADLLIALRHRRLTIAVCSNWSWDLTADLRQCGLDTIIDLIYSSAEVGYRKPHPEIYRRVLSGRGVNAAEAVFIGDSLTADVEGPMTVGIPAIQLVRPSQPSTFRWQIEDIRSVWRFLALPD